MTYDQAAYRRTVRSKAAINRLCLAIDYDGPMTDRGLPKALGNWILQRWMNDHAQTAQEKWERLLEVVDAHPEVAEREIKRLSSEDPLTLQSRRVLYLLSIGFAPKQIAALDGVSLQAVTERTRRGRQQLGAKNTTHAVALAIRRELLWH
jgi:DNA-binding CsgD family transcriptional regulator